MGLTRSTAMAAATLAIATGTASANDVAEFYKGKTITFVVGHEAGTGYDTYARTLARFMGRHIPGEPAFVVQNMPGASGLNSANWLYNVAAKDGTVLATFANTAAFEPLLGSRGGGRFDPEKFAWIGNMDENVGICGVWHTTGVTSFAQLLNSDIKFGGTSPTSPMSQSINMMRHVLGGKFSVIEGYQGGNAVKLAMARGEVQGACGISLSTLQTQWRDDYEAGRFKALAHFAMKPRPDLPGVVHIYDYAKTEEDRQLFDLVFGRHSLGRPVVGPPSVPPVRVAALRAAFTATMADKEFLGEAEKMKLDISPMSGEDLERMFLRFFATPPAVIERANRVVRRDG